MTEKLEQINIGYAVDTNNWQQICVSILSLLENNKNFINLYIFQNNLSEEQKEKISSVSSMYDNNEINFIYVNNNQFKNTPFTNFNLAYNWYRLVIADLCPYIDKIITLDEYCIVLKDLKQLWNINIEDYYAGVTDDLYERKTGVSRLNLKSKTYFNEKVMLINCKKWRKDNLFLKIKQYTQTHFHTFVKANRCALNKIIDDCKTSIPIEYNYMEPSTTDGVDIKYYNSIQYQNAKKNLAIIDFAGPHPQYSNCKHSMKKIWWEYAQKLPFRVDEIQSYKLSSTSANNSFKYGWLLSKIWPYIKPYWFRILVGFAIAIPLGLLDGVTAFALKPYMDYVIGGKGFHYELQGVGISISSSQMAFIIPIGVILFAAMQGVLRYVNGYLSTWVSQRITNDVKFDLFRRLIHMHPQFFDENTSGIIISRYMSDPGTASAGIVENIKTITTSLFGALGLIAVMFYSSWQLAFIGIIVLCVAFIPVMLIRNRIKDASNKNMVIGGKITTNINETYAGNKVMASYALQDRQDRYFQEQTWDSFHINMSLYKRAGWMSPIMYLIASFGIATVLGTGTYLINSGNMTAGSFASFVTSLLLLYKPVKTLGNTLTGIQGIFVAMGRVFELFDLTPAIKDCKNPKELKGLNKSIDFEDVNFEYNPNTPVLHNLNLHIDKNETLAIVGNSGGGKSTLVNLLPRFYDIKSGSIKFDGIDIREYSLSSLRHNISMVFQDNFLYSGTIRENILMGKPDANEEELQQAINFAHLGEMVQELPEGLETILGERGLTLSGGQRQRVAIARAMLKNAPIVILDEATSALDNESEAIVQKAMDNLMKDRTVFIIAHRLSTIQNADRIAVINEGKLVELGTHDELIKIENGQYKALYEMQFKKQAVTMH